MLGTPRGVSAAARDADAAKALLKYLTTSAAMTVMKAKEPGALRTVSASEAPLPGDPRR